MRQKSPLT